MVCNYNVNLSLILKSENSVLKVYQNTNYVIDMH